MEPESLLVSRPGGSWRRLETLGVQPAAIIDRQPGAFTRQTEVEGDRGIDRVAILERIADAEIVEDRQVLDVPPRSILEVVFAGTDARVRNAVGPEQPSGERPDVEVEIVNLIVTSLVTEDIQSDKPEGCVMFPAVDTNVGALHKPIVECGKQVGRLTGLCVRPPSFAEKVRATQHPVKIGDARWFGAQRKELEMERAAIKDLWNRPGLHGSRAPGRQRGPQGRAQRRAAHGCRRPDEL